MKANFKIKKEDEESNAIKNEDKKATERAEEEFAKNGINVWTYRSKQKRNFGG